MNWSKPKTAFLSFLQISMLGFYELPATSASEVSQNSDLKNWGSADYRNWHNFNPFKFTPAEKLVPSPRLTAHQANFYLRGTAAFSSDPTRMNVIYGRGKGKLPTKIYAKAFDVLLISGKYFQAPAAGESKEVSVGGQNVLIYGVSLYTPLTDQRLVANTAQISPFDPSRVFFSDKNMYPAVVYAKPGEQISFGNQTATVPAAGQTKVIVISSDGKLKDPGNDSKYTSGTASSDNSNSTKSSSGTAGGAQAGANSGSGGTVGSSSSAGAGAAKLRADKAAADKAAADKAVADKAAADKAAADKAAADKAAADKAVADKAAADKAVADKAAADKAAADKAVADKAAADKAAADKAAADKAAAGKAAQTGSQTTSGSVTQSGASGNPSGIGPTHSGGGSGGGSAGAAGGGAAPGMSGTNGTASSGSSGAGTTGMGGTGAVPDAMSINYEIKDSPTLFNGDRQTFQLGVSKQVCWFRIPGYKMDHTEILRGNLIGEIKFGEKVIANINGDTATVEFQTIASGAFLTLLQVKIDNFNRTDGKGQLFAQGDPKWYTIGQKTSAQPKWTTALPQNIPQPQAQTQQVQGKYVDVYGNVGMAGGDSTIQTGQKLPGSGSPVQTSDQALTPFRMLPGAMLKNALGGN